MVVLYALGVATDARAAPNTVPRRSVLVLNSDTSTSSWTDHIVKAIRNALGPGQTTEITVEVMDTRRIYNADYSTQLADTYAARYAKTHFDVIISSDDAALNFLFAKGDTVFPGTPVVFCGAHDFDAPRPAGQADDKATLDDVGIADNLDLILKQRPRTRHIYVAHDQSSVGKPPTSGGVATPLQATFWAATFGVRSDASGVRWIFNCSK